jgi:hypothetical protein
VKLLERIDLVAACVGLVYQVLNTWNVLEETKACRVKRELDKLELRAKQAPKEEPKTEPRWFVL